MQANPMTDPTRLARERYSDIVGLHESTDMNNSQIAQRLGISEGTVRNYLHKWKSGLSVEEIKPVGQPPKINALERQFITQTIERNGTATCRTLALELERTKGIEVSRRCVNGHLIDLGYRYSLPRVVPFLTDAHIQRRVEWCHKFKNFDWSSVYFSDETYIELHGAPLCVWHRNGARPTAPRSKYSSKMLFWAAISIKTRTDLISSSGTMNSERYCQMLKDSFIPFTIRSRTRRFFLQQDNAPAHISKLSKAFFATNDLKTIEWPANSPDLNPIENIWGILKRNVSIRSPTTMNELSFFAADEWAKIPAETVQKTINSMKLRILQVLERNGRKCDY